MKIHLHTLCWNDRPMVEFFLRHYEGWVDRFFILDDGSDDGTRELLEAHDNVVVDRLQRVNPDSWVLSALHIYDNAWKQSIGQADWVVVTNLDEHLYHPSMRDYLEQALELGITAIPALGYQMHIDGQPAPGSLLCRDYTTGSAWGNMSKMGIFRPDRILETQFMPGRHRAALTGELVYPEREEVCNLHYKYLGLDATHARHLALEARLGSLDRQRNFGHKYRWNKARLKQDFDECLTKSVDIRDRDHHLLHTEPRWWRKD